MAQMLMKTVGSLPKLPLPLYDMHVIAETNIESLGTCEVAIGLTENLVEQLIERTLDSADKALMHTSDRERFSSRETYEAWYVKNRTPFVLIHRETGTLMALVWSGPKTRDEISHGKWHTIGYRSYPPYRGKGFMTSFVKYILTRLLEYDANLDFWICVARENQASMALAEKLGFKKIENVPVGEDEIIMILEK